MAYQINVKKLFQDLRGPKGVAALTEELLKVGSEVEKEVARLKTELAPQAEKSLTQVRTNISRVQKRLKKAQTEFDKELKKTVTVVKKYGQQAEKKLAKLSGMAKKSGAKKKSPVRRKKVAQKATV